MSAIKFKIGDTWSDLVLDLVYPVGSLYMSINSTSPAILFGGSWAAIENRMIIGASTTYAVGNTGGSATTTISNANLPTHVHSVGAHSHELNSHTHSIGSHGHGITWPSVSGGGHSTGGGGSHGHWVNAYDSTAEFFYKSSNEANNYGLTSGGGFGGRPVVQTSSKSHTSRLYATGVGDHTH